MGSMGRLSASTADVLTLQRALRAGEQLARRSRGSSAGRSELDGRVGPRHRGTRRRRAHDEPGPRRARTGRARHDRGPTGSTRSRASSVITTPRPRSGSSSSSPSDARSSRSTPAASRARSPTSGAARSSSATRARRSSGRSASGPPISTREADLADLAHELTKREARIRAEEASLADRRSELGAVELKRAAVEQRELALAAREADWPSGRKRSRSASRRRRGAGRGRAASPLLAFVPGASYRLVEIDLPGLGPGRSLEVDDEEYVVGRVGPSPLPGDPRRCAYLVLGPRRSGSDGSS